MQTIGRATLLAAAAALLIGVTACGGGQDQSETAGQVQAQSEAPAEARPAAAADGPAFGIGNPAPDFALKNLAGETVHLSDYRGKAVIVDFWATWCGPCRMSMPHLQELSEQYADQLEILAISLDQNPEKAVPPFVKKMGLTFTVLADPEAGYVARDYGNIRSIPTTFLVDPEGVLVKQWVGMNTKAAYETELKKILPS